jgi:murein DD-endopeptidase MepM/ murein hydrolase activator NlpD
MAEINTLQELIDSGKVIGLDALQDQRTNLLKDIQAKLKNIGAYAGDLDGLYGPITERALIRFCNAVFLDNMKTQLLGPTFAKKLLDSPPPNFPPGDGNGSFIKPVGGVITSEFGWRRHPITGELRLHKGIDIGGNSGQSVLASASGTVIIAGVVSGYGNFVEIKHGDGLTSAYAHLASFAVMEGDGVSQGQKVGVVGQTGGATGPHLHFEIFRNGEPQNPRNFVDFA